MTIQDVFNKYTNTELLAFALGWQGGTIHDVVKETGLDMDWILNTDILEFTRNKPIGGGFSAVRTCSIEHLRIKCYPEHKGDTKYWADVCHGMALSIVLNERCQGFIPEIR